VSPDRLLRLARVSAAAATGRDRVLASEIRAAIARGVRPLDLNEALLQVYLFAGFPRAINALSILLETVGSGPFRRLGSPAVSASRRRGRTLCAKIYGRDYIPLMKRMNLLHPDLADWILVEGYGKTLSRAGFSPRERELLVIPVLAALGVWKQLSSHLKGALLCGSSKAAISRLLAGQKGVLRAAAVARARRLLGKVITRLQGSGAR